MRRTWLGALLGLVLAAAGCRAAGPSIKPEKAGYTLRFDGNRAFSSGMLRAQIAEDLDEFAASGLDRSFVDDAAFDLELYYQARGFPDAEVDYEVAPVADAELLAVTFRVAEGPRTLVASVSFDGATLFTGDELAGLLGGERAGLLSTGQLYYEEAAARAAQTSIEGLYVSRGYLDARVEWLEPAFSEDRTRVELTYRVAEGPGYVLGAVAVTGAGIEDPAWGALVAELKGASGQPYLPRAPFGMKSRLVEALGAAGYPDAEVELTRTRSPGGDGEPGADPAATRARVDVELAVDPGPQVTLAAVRIEGLDDVKRGFVRDLLDLRVDRPVDTGAIREGLGRLYATGLFKRVGHELVAVEGGPADHRELLVTVEEDAPLELFVEPGWGSYERARLRAGLRERNLFGRGLDLVAEGKVSTRDVRGRVQLTEPRFLGRDLEAGVSLLGSRREEPAFTSTEVGGGLFVRKRLDAHSTVTTGYQLRSTDATDVDPNLAAASDNVDLSSVSLDYRYDARQSLLRSAGGLYGFAGVEVGDEAIFSDLDFVRLRTQVAWFAELADATILGLNLRSGIIWAGDDVPVQEQFFNGGQNSVRSFQRSELAVDANGDIVGGEAASTFTLELRQRLVGDLEGAAFVDVGNVSVDASDPFDDTYTGVAYGVGLRYLLPIGALRIDVGFNPDPGPFDEDFVVHFAVGNPF